MLKIKHFIWKDELVNLFFNNNNNKSFSAFIWSQDCKITTEIQSSSSSDSRWPCSKSQVK